MSTGNWENTLTLFSKDLFFSWKCATFIWDYNCTDWFLVGVVVVVVVITWAEFLLFWFSLPFPTKLFLFGLQVRCVVCTNWAASLLEPSDGAVDIKDSWDINLIWSISEKWTAFLGLKKNSWNRNITEKNYRKIKVL